MAPTAYRTDGSIAQMPSAEDVAYCERQFDEWLARHDAEVRAAALSSPPTDDIQCGLGHMVSDLATADAARERIVPPADDVREALAAALDDNRKLRRLLAQVRLRGTDTDAEALRLGKVAWVAYQDDKAWAESVVDDCFSPADDLPEEALDMITVARAVLEAAAGVVSAGPATTAPAPAAPAEVDWEYGCRSSSHSGFMRSVATWDDEPTWRAHLAECPSPAPVRRRAAGPWVEARS